MAIVSCPECGKKLKVADASMGKKVKCSNGHIFVAQEEGAEPAKPAPSVSAEKVLVACTECGAKLKVASASLGKKMKCPKCTAVFVANVEEAPPPAPKPEPEPEPDLEAPESSIDDEPPPPVKPKAKPAADEEDDLFTFAQADADGDDDLPKPKAKKKPDPEPDLDDLLEADDDMPKPKAKPKKPSDDEDEDDMPKPKGKVKKPIDEDDEDEAPKPKAKPGKTPPPRPTTTSDAAPKYPNRLPVNILVFLMLFGFVGAFAVFFLSLIEHSFLEGLGWPKGTKSIADVVRPPRKMRIEPAKIDKDALFSKREEEEKALLAEYRKKQVALADFPGTITTCQPKGTKLYALAFSPGGKKFATLTNDPKTALTVWDLAKLDAEKPIPYETRAAQPHFELAFSRDGAWLALICREEAKVKIFDVKEGKEAKDIDLKAMPSSLAFSLDDKTLYVVTRAAGADHDKVKQIAVPGWKESDYTSVLTKECWSVINADGDRIAEIPAKDKEFVLRNLVDDKDTKTKHDPRLTRLGMANGAMSPDGQFIVLDHKSDNGPHQLLMFNLAKDEVTVLREDKEPASLPRVSPHKNKFVVCKVGAADTLIDVSEKKVKWTRDANSSAYAFSPGGVFLFSGVESDDKVAVHLMPIEDLKPTEGTKKKKKKETEVKPVDPIVELQTAEKALLAELKLKTATNPVGTLTPTDQELKAIAFSPSKMLLATYGENKKDPAEAIVIWDLKTLKPMTKIAFKNEIPTLEFHLTFSPDASLLVLGAHNGEILKVWNSSDGKEVHTYKFEKDEKAAGVAFSPDGKRMYLVTGADVKAWDVSFWEKTIALTPAFVEPHVSMINARGDRLIEIELEGDGLAIHDLKTGKVNKTKRDKLLKPDSFSHQAISPDGKYIVWKDGAEKPRLMLLDVDKNEATLLRDGEAKWPQFSPDSKHLIFYAGVEHQLVEVATKKLVWKDQGNSAGYAFSPGGAFFAIKQISAVHLMSLEDALKDGAAESKGESKAKEKDTAPTEEKDKGNMDQGFGRAQQKKYFTTWMDSLSTGLHISYGRCEDSHADLTFQR